MPIADYEIELPAALAPIPAMPSRPSRRLSTFQLIRVARRNSLAAFDEELFGELFVERRLLGRRLFVVSDPGGIRRVLHDNVANYPRPPWIRRVFEFASGTGMLHAEGEGWRRHRRLINPTLDHRALMPDAAMLIEIAEEAARLLAAVPVGTTVNVQEVFRHLITASAARVFAGTDRTIDPLLDRLGQFPGPYGMLDVLPVSRWLPVFDRRRKTRLEAETFAPMLDRMIAERRSEHWAGGKDLLWRLADVRDRDTGEGLSAAELHDEILTLAATAATPIRPITWLWYLLALHPGAEARLHAELDQMLGGRRLRPEDLGRLGYTRQLLDETMRLYPPLPLMLRTAVAEDTVCGRRVPRRSLIAIVPWVVHRHRKLWRDPDRFDPERFRPDQAAERSRYAYLPYSAGPRVCVGASMAQLQLTAAVAVLARHFSFRLVPGRAVEPTAWTNTRPRDGLWMRIEARAAAPSRAA